MASNGHLPPHYVLFPFMAQGHMIPMVDIGRLLAQRGIKITIITTPLNAARFKSVIARAAGSGLPIEMLELHFPGEKVGLPEGCENLEQLTITRDIVSFFFAADMLQEPTEKVLEHMLLRPSCIISDFTLPYTARIAKKLQIPRIVFHGFCCFCLLCLHRVRTTGILESITSGTEPFIVPDLPDRVEFTSPQIPFGRKGPLDLFEEIVESDFNSFGLIVNSFEELEPAYAKELKKARSGKTWCIGPVSHCNKDELDRAQRGSISSIDEQQCLKWLDSWEPSSVLYASLGTLSTLPCEQVIELGLGLEASERPFIWVVRDADKDFKKWLSESGFEERIKERGLLIRGWAPQLSILSHSAIGGFLTHCGWNSILEGITAGVPFLTCPLYADQFCNEKFIVEVRKLGVSVGAKVIDLEGLKEDIKVLLNKEDIQKSVNKLFSVEEEAQQRRETAKELSKLAKMATEEEGSSCNDLKLLIEDVTNYKGIE